MLFITSVCLFSCAQQIRDAREISVNGFINDNLYQAILEIEPDQNARGLVARRESAYLRGKSADLDDLALENLINYCIDNRIKSGIIGKNRKDSDRSASRQALADRLKKMARGGKIAFVFYNEKDAMIVGYRLFSIGFRKKLDAIIAAPNTDSQ